MNTPLRIEITEKAQTQISVASAWWTENRPGASDAIREELDRILGLLRVQPEIGTIARRLTLSGVRRVTLSRIRPNSNVDGDRVNANMATIAIGDIHGNIAALEDVLDQVTNHLTPNDAIVFLGDYIDRGPSTKACIDRILALRSCSDATVVTLLGNHEDWLMRTLRDPTRHSWLLGMEAFVTISSYSPAAAVELRRAAEEAGPALLTARTALPYDAFFSCVPKTHLDFLEGLVPYHRTSEAIYVHGGLNPRVPRLEDQPVAACVWGTDDFLEVYDGEELVVYGHWGNAVVDADEWPRPRIGRRSIGIDTIKHGVLTALRLPDGRIFQSRRHRNHESPSNTACT